MKRRIRMIAQFRRPGRWAWLSGIAAAALGIVCLTDAQPAKKSSSTEPSDAPALEAAATNANIVHSSPPQASNDQASLLTRSFQIDPIKLEWELDHAVFVDISSTRPLRTLEEVIGKGPHALREGPANSPGSGQERTAVTMERLRRLLRAGGVDLSPPKDLAYDDRTRTLTIRGTKVDQEYAELTLRILNMLPPKTTADESHAEAGEQSPDAGTSDRSAIPATDPATTGKPEAVRPSNNVSTHVEVASSATRGAKLRISGKVLDAETRQPIQRFSVTQGRDYWNDQRPDDRALGRDGHYDVEIQAPANYFAVRIEAEGYAPQESDWFPVENGSRVADFNLQRVQRWFCTVRTPDGRPAARAAVGFCTEKTGVVLGHAQILHRGYGMAVDADAQGRVEIPANVGAHRAVFVHESGFAEILMSKLREMSEVKLQPWGRVEGTLRIGNRSGARESVGLLALLQSAYRSDWSLGPEAFFVETDDRGHFIFEKVPPGELKLCRMIRILGTRTTRAYSHAVPLKVRPGETTRVDFGGDGVRVKGRFILAKTPQPWGLEDLACVASLGRKTPDLPNFPEGLGTNAASRQKWWADFWETEPGLDWLRKQGGYFLVVNPVGDFVGDDIPPGRYTLSAEVLKSADSSRGAAEPIPGRDSIGRMTKEVVVPEMPRGRSDELLDLGTLEIPPQDEVRPKPTTPATNDAASGPAKGPSAIDQPRSSGRESAPSEFGKNQSRLTSAATGQGLNAQRPDSATSRAAPLNIRDKLTPEQRDVLRQLNRIILPRIRFNNVALEEVVHELAVLARENDPSGRGLNLSLSDDQTITGPPLVDATTGLPIKPMPLREVPVSVPAMDELSLADALEEVVGGAVFPIRYSIEDQGVEFAFWTNSNEPLWVTSFKVDTNMVLQNAANWLRTRASRWHAESLVVPAIWWFLSRDGLEVTPPGKFGWDPTFGIVTARAPKAEFNAIEAAVQTLNRKPPNVSIDVKICDVPMRDGRPEDLRDVLGLPLEDAPTVKREPKSTYGESTEAPVVLTQARFREVWNRLEMRSGVEVVTLPRVRTLSGRVAQVEVPAVTNSPGPATNPLAKLMTDVRNVVTGIGVEPIVLADGTTIRIQATTGVKAFAGYDLNRTIDRMLYDYVPPPDVNPATVHQTLPPATPQRPAASGRAGAPIMLPTPVPIFRLRQADANATVWDGQTMVFSPTISRNIRSDQTSIPKLADLPLVGRLSPSETSLGPNTRVLIFITPTIIDAAGNRVHSDEELPFARTNVPPQKIIQR